VELNCREALELITAAADGRLEGDTRVRLESHLGLCGRCRDEFELETITKNVVRKTVRRTVPPPHLLHRIQQETAGAPAAAPARRVFWKHPGTLLAFGGVTAALVLLVLLVTPSASRHFHTHPADGNVINQTYNNFDAVLDGKIAPEIQTADFVAVKAFLTDQTAFDVKVPQLRDCALLGGVSSQYVGEHLAHVVYRRGKDLVYLYETPMKCFRQNSKLQLPEPVLSELSRTGWYIENHGGKCSLILWVVDSTLCCAIADMNKEELLACLKGSY
jgi:anti-sigma factor RsiW